VIRDAFERLTHRPGNISVDMVERRPVFVTGLVANGAYPFRPGVAVIHATALAGGMSPAIGTGLQTEIIREGSVMDRW
jgi:protein involved in polysaccharide export with SLBB domain